VKLTRTGDPGEFDIELLAREGDSVRMRVGGEEIEARLAMHGDGVGVLAIGARRYRVATVRRGDSIFVGIGPASFEFKPAAAAIGAATARRSSRGLAASDVTAPMPGKVLNILVKVGDRVSAGQPLAVIEAMKMETTLTAEGDAIVKRVCVHPGQMIDHGMIMIELSPAPDSSIPESASPAPRAIARSRRRARR